MAMSGSSMRDKIIAKVSAANPNMAAEDIAIITATLLAFCEGVVEEITENGEVNLGTGDIS